MKTSQEVPSNPWRFERKFLADNLGFHNIKNQILFASKLFSRFFCSAGE